jgi:hypothetical protein
LITWLGRRSASGPAVDVLQDYYLQKLTAEDVIAITRDLIAFVLADATLMRDLAAAAGADEMEDLLAPVLKPQLRLLHRRAIAGRRRARAARRAKKAQIKPRRGVPAGSRT